MSLKKADILCNIAPGRLRRSWWVHEINSQKQKDRVGGISCKPNNVVIKGSLLVAQWLLVPGVQIPMEIKSSFVFGL